MKDALSIQEGETTVRLYPKASFSFKASAVMGPRKLDGGNGGMSFVGDEGGTDESSIKDSSEQIHRHRTTFESSRQNLNARSLQRLQQNEIRGKILFAPSKFNLFQ